jgi:hypothetical protein
MAHKMSLELFWRGRGEEEEEKEEGERPGNR